SRIGVLRPEPFGPSHALKKDRPMSYRRRIMRSFKACLFVVAVVVAGALAGCSAASTKSADVTAAVRTSLDQAGLKDVTVSQDRDKGVITLGGHVAMDNDKAQA